MVYRGSIHLIVGPMYAGKTSELIRLKRRNDIAGKKSIIIKYKEDMRYGIDDQLYTYDKTSHPCVVSLGKSLKNTLDSIDLNNVKYIYIDEIQFYNDAFEVCQNLVKNDIHVIVTGLQGTYERKIFPVIAQLFPISDKLTQLTAIDKDSGNEAPFTKRIISGCDLEIIGGTESYKATDLFNYMNN